MAAVTEPVASRLPTRMGGGRLATHAGNGTAGRKPHDGRLRPPASTLTEKSLLRLLDRGSATDVADVLLRLTDRDRRALADVVRHAAAGVAPDVRLGRAASVPKKAGKRDARAEAQAATEAAVAERRESALLVAGAACLPSATDVVAWLRSSRFRHVPTDETADALVRVLASPGRPKLAKVADGLAQRLPARTCRHADWLIAATLLRAAGMPPPLTEGFLRGWVRDHTPADPEYLAGDPWLETMLAVLFEAPGLDRTWPDALARLAADGRVDRGDLLRLAVHRMGSDGRADTRRAAIATHRLLEPAGDEVSAPAYLALLASPHDTIAELALRNLRALDEAGLLDVETVAAAGQTVLARTEMELVDVQLRWLTEAVGRHPAGAGILLEAIAAGLGNDSDEVAGRVLDLLAGHHRGRMVLHTALGRLAGRPRDRVEEKLAAVARMSVTHEVEAVLAAAASIPFREPGRASWSQSDESASRGAGSRRQGARGRRSPVSPFPESGSQVPEATPSSKREADQTGVPAAGSPAVPVEIPFAPGAVFIRDIGLPPRPEVDQPATRAALSIPTIELPPNRTALDDPQSPGESEAHKGTGNTEPHTGAGNTEPHTSAGNAEPHAGARVTEPHTGAANAEPHAGARVTEPRTVASEQESPRPSGNSLASKAELHMPVTSARPHTRGAQPTTVPASDKPATRAELAIPTIELPRCAEPHDPVGTTRPPAPESRPTPEPAAQQTATRATLPIPTIDLAPRTTPSPATPPTRTQPPDRKPTQPGSNEPATRATLAIPTIDLPARPIPQPKSEPAQPHSAPTRPHTPNTEPPAKRAPGKTATRATLPIPTIDLTPRTRPNPPAAQPQTPAEAQPPAHAAPTATEPAAESAAATATAEPAALPAAATATTELAAQPAAATATTELAAQPAAATATTEPTAQPAAATATTEPTAQSAAATAEPAAQPDTATTGSAPAPGDAASVSPATQEPDGSAAPALAERAPFDDAIRAALEAPVAPTTEDEPAAATPHAHPSTALVTTAPVTPPALADSTMAAFLGLSGADLLVSQLGSITVPRAETHAPEVVWIEPRPLPDESPDQTPKAESSTLANRNATDRPGTSTNRQATDRPSAHVDRQATDRSSTHTDRQATDRPSTHTDRPATCEAGTPTNRQAKEERRAPTNPADEAASPLELPAAPLDEQASAIAAPPDRKALSRPEARPDKAVAPISELTVEMSGPEAPTPASPSNLAIAQLPDLTGTAAPTLPRTPPTTAVSGAHQPEPSSVNADESNFSETPTARRTPAVAPTPGPLPIATPASQQKLPPPPSSAPVPPTEAIRRPIAPPAPPAPTRVFPPAPLGHRAEPMPPPIATVAELATELAARQHDPLDPVGVERILAAVVTFAQTRREKLAEALAPLADGVGAPLDTVVRALTAVAAPDEAKVRPRSDAGAVTTHYRDGWETKPTPATKPAGTGLQSRGFAGTRFSPGHAARRAVGGNNDGVPPPQQMLQDRVRELAEQIADGEPPPGLLSTPATLEGHVSPARVLLLLVKAERAGWQPGPHDLAQALLRLPRHVDASVVEASARLTSPAGRRFAAWLQAGGMSDPVTTVVAPSDEAACRTTAVVRFPSAGMSAGKGCAPGSPAARGLAIPAGLLDPTARPIRATSSHGPKHPADRTRTSAAARFGQPSSHGAGQPSSHGAGQPSSHGTDQPNDRGIDRVNDRNSGHANGRGTQQAAGNSSGHAYRRGTEQATGHRSEEAGGRGTAVAGERSARHANDRGTAQASGRGDAGQAQRQREAWHAGFADAQQAHEAGDAHPKPNRDVVVVPDMRCWTMVLPGHREILAAHCLPYVAAAAERGADDGLAILCALARAAGPFGPAMALALAHGLTARRDADRVAAVDAVVHLAATDGLDAALVGRELALLVAAGRADADRAAEALALIGRGGAWHVVWAITHTVVPALLRLEQRPAGLPALLAVASSAAAATGAHAHLPEVTAAVDLTGDARLREEASRLAVLIR